MAEYEYRTATLEDDQMRITSHINDFLRREMAHDSLPAKKPATLETVI